MSRRALLAVLSCAAATAAGSIAVAARPGAPARAATHAAAPDALPPLPDMHPTVVQPKAGGTPSSDPATREAVPTGPDPAPTHAATRDTHGGGTGERGFVTRAIALPNGVAVPPLSAPAAVEQIIQAGDQIARTPYIWGGGHGKWLDHGYDCSGSVSFVLASAGLLDHSQVAADFMHWGKPGPGKWVTIYANAGHVWMTVAGIRFDTVARAQTGSRWVNQMTSTARYVARHPPGL
jgi:cell wall-associated NlpC family hydrolase